MMSQRARRAAKDAAQKLEIEVIKLFRSSLEERNSRQKHLENKINIQIKFIYSKSAIQFKSLNALLLLLLAGLIVSTSASLQRRNSHSVSPRALSLADHSAQFNETSSINAASQKNVPNESVALRSDCRREPGSGGSRSEDGADRNFKELGFTEPDISRFVRPSFYTLRLRLDPNRPMFSAQIMIALDIEYNGGDSVGSKGASSSQQSLNYSLLTLHAGAHINIKKAFYMFSLQGGVQIAATAIGHNATSELLTIDFSPNQITPGQGLLLLVYTGQINEDQSTGLFPHRSFPGPNASIGLGTQMQPSFARLMFPCWDEPHLKARFSLILVLPFRGYTTISNSPVKRKSISLSCSGESLQEVEFHKTPTMSTYLLALVIGKLDYVEAMTQNHCKIRVYVYSNSSAPLNSTAPSKDAQVSPGSSPQTTAPQQVDIGNYRKTAAEWALQVAVRVFDELEMLLGVRYPLNKFDLIGLRDYNSGAMENWGASIFHENYLLYSDAAPQFTSAHGVQVSGGRTRSRRLYVPLVVAHEIAHQWFGNLVTAKSWNYLWLNEGFAQYLMYELADKFFPNENYWLNYMEDVHYIALKDDELFSSSRPIELLDDPFSSVDRRPPDQQQKQPMKVTATTAEQQSVFDGITYNKGANLVRMMSFVFGHQNFFAGLKHYLLKHSYGSVTSEDLFLALEESSRNQQRQWRLDQLMDSWIHQEGIPLLSVRIYEEPDHFELVLSQTRFTLMQIESHHRKKKRSPNNQADASGEPQMDPTSLVGNWSIPLAIACELQPEPSFHQLSSEWNRLKRPQLAHFLPPSNFSGSPHGHQAHLILPKAQVGKWIKLNHNAIAPFRVDYFWPMQADGLTSTTTGPSEQSKNLVDMLSRLIAPIRSKKIVPIDRQSVVDDLFAMVKSGRKPTAYYLNFVQQAYSSENEVVIIRGILDSFKRIRTSLVSNAESISSNSSKPIEDKHQVSLAETFDNFVQRFLLQIYRAYNASKGSTDTSQSVPESSDETLISNLWNHLHTQRQTKQQAAQQSLVNKEFELAIWLNLIEFNHKETVDRAASYLPFGRPGNEQWMSSSTLFNSLDRELRASIYSAAIRKTNELFYSEHPRNSSMNYWIRYANQNETTTYHPINLNTSQTSQAIGNFEKLLLTFKGNEFQSERSAIASALGLTSDPQRQTTLIRLIYKTDFFRAQDWQRLLDSMVQTQAGRQLVWINICNTFLEPSDQGNATTNNKTSEQGESRPYFSLMGNFLKLLAPGLVEQQGFTCANTDSIGATLRWAYQVFGGQKAIMEAMENLRINTSWLKRDLAGLSQYLTTGKSVSSQAIPIMEPA